MVDGVFNRLRQKLDALGYQQVLPLGAVPLVGAIFEDLVKTTESLRDAKMQIGILLEEKSCWELGVEPYKCDNSKLLAECNSLHLDIIKQREFFEDKICEYTQKIRNLESDKRYLEDHSIGLENQIREISAKNDSKFLKNKKNGEKMNKKPFVSTVKSGGLLPSQNTDSYSSHKCMKCNSVIWAKRCDDNSNEIEKLQNDIKGQSNQLTICMKKVEARDREILRLNGLLLGGRPVAALAKDCCYKDIGPLTEDVELLQKEKHENLKMLRESRESMHEAMERALKLDEKNKKLEQDLKEFEKTALKMENQANLDVLEKEKEILKLKSSINILKNNQCPDSTSCFSEKPVLMEKLNVSTLREKALEEEINRLNNKNAKLKNKLMIQRKDSGAKTLKEEQNNFDFIRLKAERDFFHKEYLNMVEKMGSEKEHNFHRCSDNTKLFQSKFGEVPAERIGSSQENMLSSNSITAAILRAERERDIFKSELNIMRLEKSSLDEKLKLNMEMHLKEKHKFEQDLHEMQIKLSMLEKENLDMKRIQVPGQTHTVLMKEEISELRQQIYDLQIANNKINTAYNQLKILQDQTEKSLVEHQNKLLVAETHLENAESRLSCLSTNKDSTRNELGEMRNEIAVLKSSNATLEHEKDKLLIDLDIKTEKIYHLELDNQKLNKQKFELNQTIQDLNNKLERIANEKKERECELHDTSIESKTLRQHIATIKSSRDQALSDNGRLSNDLADVQAELNLVKRKLKDSEKKSDALKQQLEQYVLEVRRAEEILLLKEREREEMLEHYRCLSHDAVMLEGNNHSLEIEAAEQKRQLADTESQISNLKQELATKDGCIGKLEKQISLMSSQISSLENELEQANDDQRMLTVDLDAMKELCSKLDLQRDKINAELEECNNIRVHLEHENEILRKQISHDRLDDKCAVGSMQDLLAGNYQELENQRKISNQLNQEVIKLKKRIDELQLKVTEESHKTVCNEALAKEYSVQIQELRHNITNDRFQHAKEKEDSARYPTI